MTRDPNPTTERAEGTKAVVLLSGGLDSYTATAEAIDSGFACWALTIAYGQRHSREIDCAKRIAASLGLANHKIIRLDLRDIGGSALTSDLPVPKSPSAQQSISGATADQADRVNDIPVTYVPARNTILLSLALGWAEVVGAFDIFIGANSVDYSGYPDCRAEFIRAFEDLANLATSAAVQGRGRFTIRTPLINLTKAEIIQRGHKLGLDYSLTHSCYDPDSQGRSCGRCDSCRFRLKGFSDAGLIDPIEYAPDTPPCGHSTDDNDRQ